jgi:glycosyltransferase involved in cell wall biosynthesis
VDPQRAAGGADLARAAVSIVIPVYNEGENVVPTLRGIAEQVRTRPLEVLVVYDFDEDTTVPVLERLRPEMAFLRPLRNRRGRGALNAMVSGLESATAPFVVVSMADGSDEPQAIDLMVEKARNGADVVSGSRYMRGGGQIGGPLVKRTLSRAAGLSLHWVGGIPTHDSTSNFRLYSRCLLDAVDIESRAGFELGLELTVKAHLLGMTVDEVPTTWRDRVAGESRFRLWKWMPHYLRWYRLGIAGRLPRLDSRRASPDANPRRRRC